MTRSRSHVSPVAPATAHLQDWPSMVLHFLIRGRVQGGDSAGLSTAKPANSICAAGCATLRTVTSRWSPPAPSEGISTNYVPASDAGPAELASIRWSSTTSTNRSRQAGVRSASKAHGEEAGNEESGTGTSLPT